MEMYELVIILVTMVISLIGWVIVHRFTSRRDLENKKREIKIDLSIRAYESISLWMSEPDGGEPLKDLINTLILIQCFGSETQVENAKKVLRSIPENSNRVDGLGDLVSSLRDDFRTDIELPTLKGNVATVNLSRVP